MSLGCFASSGTVCLQCVQGTMTSRDYQGILEQNVLPTVRKFVLECRLWVVQQDNNSKQTLKTLKTG